MSGSEQVGFRLGSIRGGGDFEHFWGFRVLRAM